MAGAQFAVLGEALIDLAAAAGGRPALARPGGSPLNVAIGLARLGRPTAFVGRFSSDPFGGLLREHASGSGVQLDYALTVPEPSTTAVVRLEEGGTADYEFCVDGTSDFGWTDAELVVPPSAEAVHFGSLASWLAPGSAVIDRRMAELRADGRVLIGYDPNVRPGLQPDRAAARAAVQRSLRHAHLVKASDADLRWLYPGTEPAEVARGWLGAGPALVVVTRGAGGPLAVSARCVLDRPAHPVQVVDTVGAGDAFSSGLLDGLARTGALAPDALEALDPGAIARILDHAALVAAITCSRPGADPPTADELGGLDR